MLSKCYIFSINNLGFPKRILEIFHSEIIPNKSTSCAYSKVIWTVYSTHFMYAHLFYRPKKQYRKWHEQNAFVQVGASSEAVYTICSSRCVKKRLPFCVCEMCNTITWAHYFDVFGGTILHCNITIPLKHTVLYSHWVSLLDSILLLFRLCRFDVVSPLSLHKHTYSTFVLIYAHIVVQFSRMPAFCH